jgi:polyhydroxybutyrate depolymerase
MHSKLDANVPYTGGIGTGVTDVYYASVDSVLNVWSTINNCTALSQVLIDNERYKFTGWTGCDNGVTIHYYLTTDGGHGWPGGLPGGPNSDTPSTVINANDLLWEFFQQHQLP